MSSKFNPPVTKASYPPWCKPGPDPPPVIMIGGWPVVLTCYAHWVDLVEPSPTDLSEAFTLNAIEPGLDYYGASAIDGTRLEVGATRSAIANTWTLDLYIWDQWRDGEDFTWENVKANQDLPLKIIPPDDVVTPAIDYRSISIYG